jgi:hypothetical protein
MYGTDGLGQCFGPAPTTASAKDGAGELGRVPRFDWVFR